MIHMKKSSTSNKINTKKRLKLTFKQVTFLFLTSLVVAFLSHLFFIKEWFENIYMVGMNDGLSQILPFKRLLYDMYTNGDFFYSYEFGMGSGTFSQLGYYFSTSIVFIITVMITYGLESLGLISHPDITFWADTILVISIVRMACIITITTGLFRYINIPKVPAFVGSTIYGTSVIYFRHVEYWEFFADAMIWLPILLFGIEKIIREKKMGWFIVGVAICVFDNFYFAYVNFALAAVYIIFRWINPFHKEEEQKIGTQVKLYLLGGLTGLGIGAVSFIPAVYGYLNNYRPPYDGSVSLFGFPDNILLDGRIIVLPVFAVICLFLFSLYKDRFFRFFASLTILTICMHYSPHVASLFNGFSAPQYRWEYFMPLVAGALIASALTNIQKVSKKGIVTSVILAFFTYISFFMLSNFSMSSVFTFKVAYLAVPALIIFILVISYSIYRNNKIITVLTVLLVVISVFISNGFQKEKLSHAGTEKEVSKEYFVSDSYNGHETRALIQKIQESEENPLYRIEWMYPTRNNTPLTQQFNGFSAYSSILNQQLLFFYYTDLAIDMGRESVSRYGTLGDRANLYSILAGKYSIAKKDDTSIPYGFEEVFAVGDYIAYQNKNILPFVRTTKTVFTEEDLANASPVDREHAMLKGIILPDEKSTGIVPHSANLMKDVAIIPVGATYRNDILHVTTETGGIDLVMNEPNLEYKDYFVSFYLKSLESDQFFHMSVNDYITSRKSNSSIYQTEDYSITIRTAADDKISIRVPAGEYKLKSLELYGEDYRALESAKEESKQKDDIPLKWTGNQLTINYNNQTNEQYMMLPIPFEKGWHVYINGKKKEVLEANYAFIGFELEDGMNDIKLIYYPPYFFISLYITIITLVITLLSCWWFKKLSTRKMNEM